MEAGAGTGAKEGRGNEMKRNQARCKTGKLKIKNELRARAIATRMWAKQPNEIMGDIHAWKCDICGYWHVGHQSKRKEKAA